LDAGCLFQHDMYDIFLGFYVNIWFLITAIISLDVCLPSGQQFTV